MSEPETAPSTPRPRPPRASGPKAAVDYDPAADPLDLHTELRTMLAMASGLGARFLSHVVQGVDEPRAALALYAEFVDSVERVYRRFGDPRDRRDRKVQPRRRNAKASTLLDDHILTS